jgi:hypothetical protein
MPMRSLWVGLLLIGSAFGARSQADAGTLYKSYVPALAGRERGIIELTFEAGKVSGQMLPRPGTTDRPIAISGTNPADGVLELTFHFPVFETETFEKSLEPNEIRWTSTSGRSRLWRPRYSEFSDAALTLERDGDCGPIYRSLRIAFYDEASSDRISTFMSDHRDLGELPVTFRDPNNRPGIRRLTLGRALAALLQIKEPAYRSLEVPIGTEVTVATTLNRSGFMVVNLGEGGCGGGDASFFVLDRSFLFEGDSFLKDKLVAFLDQSLRAFAGKDRNGRTLEYSVGKGELSTLKIAPFTSSYHVKMRMASEVSRRVAGRWDTFEVWFDPVELVLNTRSEYSVVVTVEGLQSKDRSTGRPVRFKDENAAAQATAEIEAALLVFLSQRSKNGWCQYGVEGLERAPKAKCGGRRPPRVEQ